MIQSPLNYTGGKYKLLPQILPLFPKDINCFVDLFCGGCNVGINVCAKKYVYNDSCEPLINLYSVMQTLDSASFIEKIETVIKRYGLSDVKLYGYDFYNCNSSDGLGVYNRDKYMKLRADFNALKERNVDYYVMLYVLIVYAFNNQIRFNRNGEFNLPPGKRDFNQKMHSKVENFIELLQNQNATFIHSDFREIEIDKLTDKDFVYVDPPYLITCAAYNEQGGWSEVDEEDLLQKLDDLSQRGIKFALSNVLESKGREGDIVIYEADKVIMLEATLMNASSQKRGEWEPLLRHSINLKVEEETANTGREVTSFFIADSFDYNTINIWKAVAAVPLQSSNDKDKFTDNVVIMPVNTDELSSLIDKSSEYDEIISKVHKLFEVDKINFDIEWREKFMGAII